MFPNSSPKNDYRLNLREIGFHVTKAKFQKRVNLRIGFHVPKSKPQNWQRAKVTRIGFNVTNSKSQNWLSEIGFHVPKSKSQNWQGTQVTWNLVPCIMLLDPRSENACVVKRPEIAISILTSQLSGSYEATVRMGFPSSSPRKRPTARNTQQRERRRRCRGLRHLPRLPLLCKPTRCAVQLRLCGLHVVDRFGRRASSFFAILLRLSIDTFVSSSRVSSLGWFYAFPLLQLSVVWWNVCNLE